MEGSQVKSESKSGNSDFSIERILSDDLRGRSDEGTESPNWLCCTRYRPPRLPRVSSSAGSRPRRSGRHARVPFTAAQAAALEGAYARSPYLAPPALRALAAALQLRDDRIKIWFQNRRARDRREKSIAVAPPLAMTLPPTAASHTFVSSRNHWLSNLTGSNIDTEERIRDTVPREAYEKSTKITPPPLVVTLPSTISSSVLVQSRSQWCTTSQESNPDSVKDDRYKKVPHDLSCTVPLIVNHSALQISASSPERCDTPVDVET